MLAMKNITEYITEAKKSFTLSTGDRDALTTLVGFATGNIGDDNDIKQFDKFNDELYELEKKNLSDLYDLLEDDRTYPKINNRIMDKEYKGLVAKLLDYIEDNCDNLLDEYSYEIGNLEEIFFNA